jgi:hypothetical protein
MHTYINIHIHTNIQLYKYIYIHIYRERERKREREREREREKGGGGEVMMDEKKKDKEEIQTPISIFWKYIQWKVHRESVSQSKVTGYVTDYCIKQVVYGFVRLNTLSRRQN